MILKAALIALLLSGCVTSKTAVKNTDDVKFNQSSLTVDERDEVLEILFKDINSFSFSQITSNPPLSKKDERFCVRSIMSKYVEENLKLGRDILGAFDGSVIVLISGEADHEQNKFKSLSAIAFWPNANEAVTKTLSKFDSYTCDSGSVQVNIANF